MKTIETAKKVGYLNLKTGKYKYVEIVEKDDHLLKMREKIKTGKYSLVFNNYTEKVADIKLYTNTPSIDWKDGRPLLKLI